MGAEIQSGGGRKRRSGIVAINITPMVDVMLVLLIIMMVSAKFIVAQSLKVELPKSASSDETVSSTLQVAITRDGKFYFNEEPVRNDNELTRHFKSARASNEDINLVVRADNEAMHGRVVHVIDLAKQNGIHKFAINVQREQ
jgi:biopolymer transport protein ExbD